MTKDDGEPRINALVAEFAVSDLPRSLRFYCGLLGFGILYDRPEEAFAFLALGDAQLMLYQIGAGRTLAVDGAALEPPLGRGMNLQIQVAAIEPLVTALAGAGFHPALPPERRWYRAGTHEIGVHQFAVADPDGYFLRFGETVGRRPVDPSPRPGT